MENRIDNNDRVYYNKSNMENNDINKETEVDFKQLTFLILIIIFICILIFTIIFFINNRDVITKDGISYEMTRQNFSYCSCMGEQGVILFNNLDKLNT